MNARAIRDRERIIGFASPVALVVLWEIVVRVGLLPATFFPAPSAIVGSFAEFVRSGEVVSATLITLQRILIGFFIGAIPGIAAGLIIGINRWVRAAADPIVSILYPIPKIAILPLVLIVFGLGESGKYAIVAIGVFFIMLINTASGVRQIESIFLDVAHAYRIRTSAFFLRVLLPGSLPSIFAGVKISIGVAIVLAVAAEFTAARSGLGYVIWNAWQLLMVERMYVGLVMISVLGIVLSTIADRIERLVVPWRASR